MIVRKQRQGIILLLLIGWILTGCRSRPASQHSPASDSSQAATLNPASDEEAIRSLLLAESKSMVAQDIESLAGLWAEDAVVRDAKHTPENEEDDAVWRGIDAILDRYVVLVFPGNPQFAEPQVVSLQIQGDEATVVSTTHIGAEVAPQGDRWTFVKRDGRWWIASLTYNLEPGSP